MTTSKTEKQYPIPPALPAILKGFARETLRAQVCYTCATANCAANVQPETLLDDRPHDDTDKDR